MEGARPYVDFNPSYRTTAWPDRTGLTGLSDEELEAAYSRATVFLRSKERELVEVRGWSAQPGDDAVRNAHSQYTTTLIGGEQRDIDFIPSCWDNQLVWATSGDYPPPSFSVRFIFG